MAEAMIAEEPVKMLYAAALDFDGCEFEALWHHAASGVKHWHDFARAAGAANRAVTMLKPSFPCEVRLFGLAAAKAWNTNTKKANA